MTIIQGVHWSAFSFTGYFSSTLFKKISMRSIGLIGAFFYTLGSLLTVFVTSVAQLMVTYGILEGKSICGSSILESKCSTKITGSGAGLMVAVAYSTFNHYFVTKRVFMMGITQALKGLGIICYPIIVQFLQEKYDFCGMLAILTAINSHCILAMIVMHPVDWHLKSIRVPVDESESCKLMLSV